MRASLELSITRLAACALLVYAAGLHAEGFKADGTISFSAFRSNRTVFDESRDFSLVVDVDKERWLIRTAKTDSINYTEKSFDDSAIYTLTCQYLQTNGTAFRANAGKIEEFPVPDPDGSRINTLWLGYGSAGYFKSLTSNMVHPHWPLDDPAARLRGFTVEGSWILNKDAVGLPASVVYKSDGIFRGLSSRNGQPVSFRERPPFDYGYTQAVFTVTLSTNLGTYTVPLAFTFRRFGVGTGKYELLTEEVASVRSVERCAHKDTFIPPFVGKADIYDGRFRVPSISKPGQYDYFRYSSSNGVWPTFTEVAAKYGRVTNFLVHHHAKTKTEIGYIKRIIVVSMMLLSMVPVFMYLIHKQHNR